MPTHADIRRRGKNEIGLVANRPKVIVIIASDVNFPVSIDVVKCRR